MTRTIVYINFLVLQSGLSENIFRSSTRNCLLVLWSFKIVYLRHSRKDCVVSEIKRKHPV